MLREYKEEAGLDFPKNHTLENTFTWCNKYLIFLVTTDAEISDGEVKKNKEIFSRKWFSIDEIKNIIQASKSKQIKGVFKMRNGAGASTDAIIKFMKY
jgi:8-oxo-dGTP pyrophosphatase MutT (NUDIX family)